MEKLDMVEIYGFYRNVLNAIQDRVEAIDDDAVLQKFDDVCNALRAAFLEEVFPCLLEMEDGWRYPAAEHSADLAQKLTDSEKPSVSR